MPHVVTLLTDFGDYYPGVMEGVILKNTPQVNVVDITHSVEPQNVFQGAFLLLKAYGFFPPCIHVAVIDPGVGTKRKAIIVECDYYTFIGPDNGILFPACRESGIKRIWMISEQKIAEGAESRISTTFHGRDLFAPAVSYVIKGRIPEIAEEIEELEQLDVFECHIEGEEISCRVLFVDRFGNAVTNLKREVVEQLNPKVFNIGKQNFPLVVSYSDVEIGSPLSVMGSFDTLELSVREGNASKRFDLKSGWLKLGVG
ncbi:MAG: S-adenosyl-l-methionine hydroxide adenosyltransferase family protein [Archaeoglobaceae archaeon]